MEHNYNTNTKRQIEDHGHLSESELFFTSGVRNKQEEVSKLAAQISKCDYDIEQITREKNELKTEILKRLPSGLSYNLTERIHATRANGTGEIIAPGFYDIVEGYLVNSKAHTHVNLSLISASDIGRIFNNIKLVL